MISDENFNESIERIIKNYQDELAKIPETASVLRNIILGQIRAVHKVRADVLLDRTPDAMRTEADTIAGEERLRELMRGDWHSS